MPRPTAEVIAARQRRVKKYALLSGGVIAITLLASLFNPNPGLIAFLLACGAADAAFFYAAWLKLKKAQNEGPARRADSQGKTRSRTA